MKCADGPDKTLSEYVTGWVEALRLTDVAENTRVSYGQQIAHVLKRLGGVKLRDLTPQNISAAYAALLADGVGVRHVHQALHVALGDAVNEGLIATNPASMAKKPRRPRAEGDAARNCWTEAEAVVFSTANARASCSWPTGC